MVVTLEIPTFFNKFAPKLTFEWRCAIFALHHRKGVPYSLLSNAFGVHRRTIMAICKLNSDMYRRVKSEEARLGIIEMYDTYVNDEHIQRITDAEKKRRAHPVSLEPSKAHNKHEGFHYIKGKKFEIRWHDLGDGDIGWAYFDPDFKQWLMGDNGVFRTSTECLRYLEKNE